jgi:hypothetical protein
VWKGGGVSLIQSEFDGVARRLVTERFGRGGSVLTYSLLAAQNVVQDFVCV